MANEPSWDDIFRPADPAQPPSPVTASPSSPSQASWGGPAGGGPAATGEPLTRRQLREAEGRRPSAPRQSSGAPNKPPKTAKKKRRKGPLIALIVIVALIAAGGGTGWLLFEKQIRHVLGWEAPIDYTTSGNGEAVTIVIQSGDIGSNVAKTLQQAGVTLTFEAFYQLLLKNPKVSFEPGSYTLQKQMSAASALAALQDPANKVVNAATLKEGISAVSAYAQLSVATGIPVADFETAAKDYVAMGVPAGAPSIEGFLFPATYPFDPGLTAHAVLQRLVTEMLKRLDAAGVAPADRLKVVTLASIVQREAGPNPADLPKIARVFDNRMQQGMRLQSDATVAYGTGHTNRVTTTDAERADASNLYNTYAHDGLPIGPIGLPGQAAIDAVLHPADGTWLYFVAVNLKTGETVFSTTLDEHNAAVKQWQAWCRQSAENAAYCA